MAKSSTYWDKRALRRLSEAEKLSEEHIKRIKKIYEQAYRDVSKEIQRVYRSYSKDTGLDIEKIRELLSKKETDKVWKTLKRQGLDKYIKDNYKSRISRLEQIQAQIYARAKQIYPKEELEHTMAYKGVINDSYYKAVYDTQIGTGYDFAFTKLDNRTTNLLLNEKWSGKNYSQRIWGNTDILADSLSSLIGGAMLSGQGIDKTTRQIRERFNVSKYYAERLVRTETNHFNNEADAMAYEELGINKYVFVATLDSRTSEICQSHDNKVYDYKDKETGVNYPPLHPNCRSKTRGYLGEEAEKNLKRRARNPKTGKNEIIDNMSYSEWLKHKDISSEDITKAREKYYNNKKYRSQNDKIQHENYKKYFKELENVDKFNDIKYNKSEIWGKYKKDYRVLNQYNLDNGTWSNKKIIELDNKAISFKRNNLRSKEKYSGNIGVMELDGVTYYAHSGLSNIDDKGVKNLNEDIRDKLILSQAHNKYKATKVDGYIRDEDSEYKLFNFIANHKQPNETFTVDMLSERCMCDSCKGVIEQFIKDYPNATLNMVSNKRMKDPWKYRRRKK